MKKTSLQAMGKMTAIGKTDDLLSHVYSVIAKCDHEIGVTGAEIHKELDRLGHRHQLDSVRPRMASLQRKGLVKVIAVRKCGVTGESVQAWAPGKSDIRPPKPSWKEMYLGACKRIEELEARIKSLEAANAKA